MSCRVGDVVNDGAAMTAKPSQAKVMGETLIGSAGFVDLSPTVGYSKPARFHTIGASSSPGSENSKLCSRVDRTTSALISGLALAPRLEKP